MTDNDTRDQDFALRKQTSELAETMRCHPEQWGEMGVYQRITTAGNLLRCQRLYAERHLTEFPESEGRSEH